MRILTIRNKFPGTCYRCGKRVEAGEGFFEKTNTTHHVKWGNVNLPKFLVQHVDCAELWKGTNQHYTYGETND